MRRTLVCLGIVLLLLPAVALAQTQMQSASGFEVSASDEVMGRADAPVTLIEYASPSCPFCARFHAEAFPAIKQKYIDSGKVRIVFRLFPLRAIDGDAEKLARCALDYFRFMDVLFRNQSKWDPEYGISDSRPPLLALAASSDLTAAQANNCINNTALDSRINAVAQEAESRYGVNGTPAFVIDGAVQPIGYRSPDELIKPLDDALAKKH
jgi:protein-disulfide isomerase